MFNQNAGNILTQRLDHFVMEQFTYKFLHMSVRWNRLEYNTPAFISVISESETGDTIRQFCNDSDTEFIASVT